MPYYVEGMWLADQAGNELIANHYGPNKVDTTVAGRKISIVEETNYPFDDKVSFIMQTDVDTTLILRKPPCCGAVKVDAAGKKVKLEADRISIRGAWKKGEVVKMCFNFAPQRVAEPNLQNETYYRWGALLFSLPLGETRKPTREFTTLDGKPSGFFSWEVKPEHPERWDYKFDPKESFRKVALPGGNDDAPYAQPPIGLRGRMIDRHGAKVEVTLTPLGASLLRRTSFPDVSKPIAGPQEEWIVKDGAVNPDGTIKEAPTSKKPAPSARRGAAKGKSSG